MTFSIEWDRRAAKKVEKLPQFISFHVLEKFDKVAQDPFRYLEHFEGEKVYKLRIGDYRALIDIDLKEKIIFIRHFDHRHRVYDRQSINPSTNSFNSAGQSASIPSLCFLHSSITSSRIFPFSTNLINSSLA